MAMSDSLARMIDPAPLLLTVRGIKERFRDVLGVTNFSVQFHNNWKQGLRASKPTGTSYPHGGFKMTAINVTENNIKNMLRVGTGDGIVSGGNNNAILQRSFLIPVLINCECEIKFQDMQEALAFCTAASIFLPVGMLSFEIAYARNKWHSNVTLSGGGKSMPLPMIDDLNEGSTPGTAAVTFSLDVTSKIGFIRDITKINNYGAVQFNVEANPTPPDADINELNSVLDDPQYALSKEEADELRRTQSTIDMLMRGIR
jgi:hypothetical protein